MHTNIKTFEDACKALNISSDNLPNFSPILPAKHVKGMLAHFKLVIIVLALNGGWEPDWNNNNQYKWFPWFNMQNGFRYDDADYYITYSLVGSRLCFRSEEIASYAGEQFIDLYKDYFTIDK